jgi:hypothetical protein
MTHSKAKREFSEEVKIRVEEARQKLKQPRDAAEEDASERNEEMSSMHTYAFPSVSEFDLTILKERARSVSS